MRIDPESTLTLWEGSLGRPTNQRDEVLLGAAPSSLAQRNTLALQRYVGMFGPHVELTGHCPHCGVAVEFRVDIEACARQLPLDAADEDWHELEADEERVRFRLPQPTDLHALEYLDDETQFAELLLARCVEGGLPGSASLCEAISRRIEAMAPGASVHFGLQCPDCQLSWNAPLDPVDLLGRELRQRAERLLAEVAVLARGLGWSERDILGLSPVRRAAYLQLVSA